MLWLILISLANAGTLCADGWVSPSSGRGTCSWHGGIAKYHDLIAMCDQYYQVGSENQEKASKSNGHQQIEYQSKANSAYFLASEICPDKDRAQFAAELARYGYLLAGYFRQSEAREEAQSLKDKALIELQQTQEKLATVQKRSQWIALGSSAFTAILGFILGKWFSIESSLEK